MSEPVPSSRTGPAGPAGILWGRAVSWAFYDFANTIYSALVVSFAVALHVKRYTGVEKYTYLTIGLSLLASGLLLPFAGEVADRTGRPRRYLGWLTLLTCACCAAMAFADGAWLILALFFVANFSYNSSLTFYDSLLPTLGPPERLGTVSGLGVGLGYAGVAFALPIGWGVLRTCENLPPRRELAPLFALAGVLFLLFSLPLFLYVPEKPATKRTRPGAPVFRLAYSRVLTTLRLLPRHKPLLLFLLGNFFMVDSLNTGIVAAAPYMVHVFGLPHREAMLWLIPFSLGAGVLGVLGGRLVDAFGPRRIMLLAGFCVMAALVLGALAGSFALFIVAFVLLGGFGLANIWVAGRRLLLELVPPGQVGKYFGLYNVGHKLSMIGPVAFGLLADLKIPSIPAGGYRLGLLCQIPLLVVGLLLIRAVRTDDD